MTPHVSVLSVCAQCASMPHQILDAVSPRRDVIPRCSMLRRAIRQPAGRFKIKAIHRVTFANYCRDQGHPNAFLGSQQTTSSSPWTPRRPW